MTTEPIKKKHIFLCLFIIAICAVLVRVVGLGDYYYSYDDMWRVYVAKQPTIADMFYVNLTEENHPLLPYIIQHYLLKIWDDPWMARLPALVAGVLSIPAAYFMGKEMFRTQHGGLFAAFFIAFSKVLIEQSQTARAYTPMMLFVIIAFWAVYAYDNRQKFRYIIIYFLSMIAASLFEFAFVPLIVFSSAFLLYSVWRKSRDKGFQLVVCVVFNLLIIGYLFSLYSLFKDVGNYDLGKHPTLRDKSFVVPVAYFFLIFMKEVGFNYAFQYLLPISACVSFFVLAASFCSFSTMYKNRYYDKLLIPMVFFIITAALYYMDMNNLLVARRSIGVVIPAIVLVYYGATFLDKKFNLSAYFRLSETSRFSTFLSLCAVIFTASFLINKDSARGYIEFPYKNALLNEYVNELEDVVDKNDIVISHRIISFYFWERYGMESYISITKNLSYLGGYKVPIYTPDIDYRICSGFCVTVYDLQKAILDMDSKKILEGDDERVIWLASLFILKTFHAIRPLEYDSYIDMSKLDLSNLKDEEKTFYRENADFKKWLADNAVKSITKEECKNNDKKDCTLKYGIYGVKAKDLVAKMRSVTYHDPFTLLNPEN